jgi:hypothetical protein
LWKPTSSNGLFAVLRLEWCDLQGCSVE